MSHTKEPWVADGNGIHSDRTCIALTQALEASIRQRDAIRIVACVNACAGLPNEMLDSVGYLYGAEYKQLEQDNATLRAVLQTQAEEAAKLMRKRDELLDGLNKIADQLRDSGASVPAPENKGTIESAMATGMSIALLLVETAITNATN